MSRALREPVSARVVFTTPTCLLAFGFGVGLIPIAPGTFGTLVGVLAYCVFAGLALPVYGALVFGLALAGIGLCAAAAKTLQVGDHPGIVWDEIVGLLITMFGVPFSLPAVALGFVCFRVFDILKPWPIGWADRCVGGGLGIMLDDILAGLYAAAVLQIARAWVPM